MYDDYDRSERKEVQPFAASRGPKVLSGGKLTAAVLGSGLLVAGGSYFGLSSVFEAPQQEDYIVKPATQQPTVEIMDPDDVLTADDERRMLRDIERIDVGEEVEQVNYMVFETNDDNVNDTVENYLRDHHPDLIDDDYFTDGQLFVGVGLDPRQAFIFAGEDVAEAYQLKDESDHLEESLDAIKPGVRDNNIPAGLFAGADNAVSAEKLTESTYEEAKSDRNFGVTGGGVGAGVVAATIVGIGAGSRRKKQSNVITAREDWDYVSQTYADVAARLDAIDVRAHSLSSDLLNSHLRKQWEKLRKDFLKLDRKVSPISQLSATSPDEEYEKHAEKLAKAAQTCERMEVAEKNIDKLYGIEHADAATREHELYKLEEDLHDASVEAGEYAESLQEELRILERDARALRDDPTHPEFMDNYLTLLNRGSRAMHALQNLMQKKNEADEDPKEADIYDRGFFAGVGAYGFIPFYQVSSWNSNAEMFNSNSSSGGVNSSFSSGFSGSGGSSSF